MTQISRNLLASKAVMPPWFVLLLFAGGLFSGAAIYFGCYETIKTATETNTASLSITESIVNKPAIFFGIVFCSFSATISALVLVISLPVFLFSSNAERVIRAGGLVKTTLGFFVGSAGTIIATISLAPI